MSGYFFRERLYCREISFLSAFVTGFISERVFHTIILKYEMFSMPINSFVISSDAVIPVFMLSNVPSALYAATITALPVGTLFKSLVVSV